MFCRYADSVCRFRVISNSRDSARDADDCTAFIAEQQLTGSRLLANKATFMYQPVMVPAQQYQVLQTGLAAIRPVPDVVTVYEMPVRTARETAVFIPGP